MSLFQGWRKSAGTPSTSRRGRCSSWWTPSTPWPMLCTTCTVSSALDTRGCVHAWPTSTAKSCWPTSGPSTSTVRAAAGRPSPSLSVFFNSITFLLFGQCCSQFSHLKFWISLNQTVMLLRPTRTRTFYLFNSSTEWNECFHITDAVGLWSLNSFWHWEQNLNWKRKNTALNICIGNSCTGTETSFTDAKKTQA